MATTVSHSYENVFNVFDYVTQARIGQIAPSGDDEWAAYRANMHGDILTERIGTYQDAEHAIRAVDQDFKDRKRK